MAPATQFDGGQSHNATTNDETDLYKKFQGMGLAEDQMLELASLLQAQKVDEGAISDLEQRLRASRLGGASKENKPSNGETAFMGWKTRPNPKRTSSRTFRFQKEQSATTDPFGNKIPSRPKHAPHITRSSSQKYHSLQEENEKGNAPTIPVGGSPSPANPQSAIPSPVVNRETDGKSPPFFTPTPTDNETSFDLKRNGGVSSASTPFFPVTSPPRAPNPSATPYTPATQQPQFNIGSSTKAPRQQNRSGRTGVRTRRKGGQKQKIPGAIPTNFPSPPTLLPSQTQPLSGDSPSQTRPLTGTVPTQVKPPPGEFAAPPQGSIKHAGGRNVWQPQVTATSPSSAAQATPKPTDFATNGSSRTPSTSFFSPMDVDSSLDKTTTSPPPPFHFGQQAATSQSPQQVPPQKASIPQQVPKAQQMPPQKFPMPQQGPPQQAPMPQQGPPQQAPIPQATFNIGKSEKKKRSPIARRRDRHRRCGNGFVSPSVQEQARQRESNQNAAGAQGTPRGRRQETRVPTTFSSKSGPNTGVDNSGRVQYVLSLREDARTAYCQSEYKSSVKLYTKALTSYPFSSDGSDNLRAILQANRGAALLMLGATDATVYCCEEALKFVSDTYTNGDRITSDSGPLLKVKVLTRLGRALYKCGQLDRAEMAFQEAINTADGFRVLVKDNLDYIRMFENARGDAGIGQIEVQRCRKELNGLKELGLNDLRSPMAMNKRDNNHALNKVKMALSFASESKELTTLQVVILACLKRWREIASVCERVAVRAAKLDGCYEGDLEGFNPSPGLPDALHLPPTFFEKDDARILKLTKLEATTEVIARLPVEVVPAYLRALRLEERYKNAAAAVAALEAKVPVGKRPEYAWLSTERNKLNRTHETKDAGDQLFKDGKYQRAIDMYSICLAIDGEELPSEMIDLASEAGNGGGKLHAVLHCNRAASFMQLHKYQEALKDCEAALRIYPTYMKAILRRSRCYSRLKRYDESIASFDEYFKLVEDAKATDRVAFFLNANCIFDTPMEMDPDSIARAKNEFLQVKDAKVTEDNEARAQQFRREQNRAWYQQNFGSESSARDRRDQWYNEKSGSRRWDSFNNGSRGQGGSGQHGRSNGGGENFSHRWNSSRREEPRRHVPPNDRPHSQRYGNQSRGRANQAGALRSPVSDKAATHYSVLEVSRTATETDIKKAYKRMALKYHPDKNQEAGADDKFRRVKAAYDILSNPRSRRNYDDEIRWRR